MVGRKKNQFSLRSCNWNELDEWMIIPIIITSWMAINIGKSGSSGGGGGNEQWNWINQQMTTTTTTTTFFEYEWTLLPIVIINHSLMMIWMIDLCGKIFVFHAYKLIVYLFFSNAFVVVVNQMNWIFFHANENHKLHDFKSRTHTHTHTHTISKW